MIEATRDDNKENGNFEGLEEKMSFSSSPFHRNAVSGMVNGR